MQIITLLHMKFIGANFYFSFYVLIHKFLIKPLITIYMFNNNIFCSIEFNLIKSYKIVKLIQF